MPPPTDYGRQQIDRLFRGFTRGICDEKELGHYLIHSLIDTRWFEGVEGSVERLPPASREFARNYARELADPGYTFIFGRLGGGQPTPEQRARELADLKEVAGRVLAALEEKPT